VAASTRVLDEVPRQDYAVTCSGQHLIGGVDIRHRLFRRAMAGFVAARAPPFGRPY